ncbi:oxysterol-binding protein-related protein 1D-like isoform X1 [Bidens hawaiensis]|uniref:oxysterol-binding protein-related protein 1D-like isoform X1 n=1 Tax=Bidens hawaiensis TaxID=980011 RepID=UPI00404ABFAD
MNPLCCIAPVSIEKDRTGSPLSGVEKRQSECQLGFESSARSVRPATFSAQVSSVGTESENVFHEIEDCEIEVREKDSSGLRPVVFGGNGGGVVAGILYKWVNYGKGWRSRWFTLEDGVLSYYKTHGPDKIVLSPGREKGFKVIGDESIRYMRKCSNGSSHNRFGSKQWKPYGEIHLKVSSVRASKSDDKRLSIFSGTKTLHLRCISREDRAAWIESLLAAKDKFPRLSTGDLVPSEELVISTEKLRSRLSQEGITEEIIKDCESIMLSELTTMQNQMKTLQLKHIVLLDTLRQLETEKIELETTVVDETKERDSCCGQDRRFSDFYSILSEGSGTDSDADNESRYGVDIESDEETGTFFDTNEFMMSADVLRCASYRGRENYGTSSSSNEKDSFLSGYAGTEINLIQYPHIKRRGSLPEPKEKERPVGLWSIIKDNIGKDLSGVCLPVYFNEPLSSLPKCFEDLEYSCLVDRALEWGKQGNDLMRILSIAAFAVSGYASTEGRQCKPFNPLLGETYEADYPDKGLRFFSEKVNYYVNYII